MRGVPDASRSMLRPCPSIVVFAKSPEAGRVKTRLCPPLSPAAAAVFQRACLADLWARLACLPGVHRVLCHDPPTAADLFHELLGAEIDLTAQPQGDLGQRLAGTFETLFARGLGPILAIGADSPDLPLSLITQAMEILIAGECDVVVVPALDGGYTLIGLGQPHREPFEAIPWSTAEVAAATLSRCRQAGLNVRTLSPWYDVDDAPSLARLRARVLACPDELPCLYRLLGQDNLGITGEDSPVLASRHALAHSDLP